MTDLLVFKLAGQQYALSVADVAEVVPRASLTRLAGVPKDVVGMLRLRGALVPVVDLRLRLGIPAAVPHIGQCIIVMRRVPTLIGFLVDAVVGVVAGPSVDGDVTKRSGSGRFVRYVQEIAGQVVAVLDPEAVIGLEVEA